MRNFTADNSAWADFLISKAALILASVVLFAALFGLAANSKDFETQKQLDYLVLDFKNEADMVGAMNFQEEVSMGSSSEFSDRASGKSYNEFKEVSYCFNEKEVFRTLPFGKDIKLRVSGEYVSLEAEFNGIRLSAVRPFAFRILPLNESALQEKLHTRYGVDGSQASPLTDDCSGIKAFIQTLGAKEAIMNPKNNVSLKKELIYINDKGEVSAFAYVLIYQNND